MIEWEQVDALRHDIGEDDFGDVVELFFEEVGQALEQLKDNSKPQELGELLHFLKGNAVNLGFSNFALICQNGEDHVRHDTAHKVDVDRLIESFARSREVFLAGLSRVRQDVV